jgi:hypothetical protein
MTTINGILYNLSGSGSSATAQVGTNTGYSNPTLTIPNTVTYSSTTYNVVSIGGSAFSGNQTITSVNLSACQYLTIINTSAFYGCTSLNIVKLSPNLTTIRSIAFAYCSRLSNVYFYNSNLATLNISQPPNYSFSNISGSAIAYYSNEATGFSNLQNQTYFSQYLTFAPCFKEDTKILTDKGYIPIQHLKKGDLVKTLYNDFKPIDMIGKKEINHPASKDRIKNQLYICTKNNYPEIFEPLIITGCHSILVDEFVSEEQRQKTIEVNGDIYVTDKKYRLPACVDERASVYEVPGTYTTYHFALENDNYYWNYGVFANGLLVETCSKRYLKELSGMTIM